MTDNSWSLAFQGIIFTLLLAPTLFLFGADSTRSSRWPCRFQHEQSHDFFFFFLILLSRTWRLKLSTVSNVLFYFTRSEKVQSQLNSQMQCVELWENFIHSGEVIKTDEMQRYICCLRRILLKQFPLFLNCFCPSISTSLHSGEKRK